MTTIMKKTDFSALTKEELREKEKALREELFSLSQQRYSARVEKPHRFSLIKRDIARIKTALNTRKE